MEDGKRLYIDLTCNTLGIANVRKQYEQKLKKHFDELIPKILKRSSKVHAFMTDEIGFYSRLLSEAKWVYELGSHYSTVSMIGIAAERFSIELEEKIKLEINGNPISKEDVFGKRLGQYKRLRMLLKAKLISQQAFEKLDRIREIRDRYIHPRLEINPENDSIEVLNLMIDVIQSRFSERYRIENGVLVTAVKHPEGVKTYKLKVP